MTRHALHRLAMVRGFLKELVLFLGCAGDVANTAFHNVTQACALSGLANTAVAMGFFLLDRHGTRDGSGDLGHQRKRPGEVPFWQIVHVPFRAAGFAFVGKPLLATACTHPH